MLRVNPNNGVATLKNDSLETLVFDGFEITSTDVAAALNVTTFTPITGGTGTWQKDAEGTTGLSQVNFTGARTLTPGQEVSIGDISSLTNPFATDAAKNGLSMRFILAEGLESSAATGDYNNNGAVDAADYTLWRDNLGGPATELANRDPLNAGVISNADYTSWVANFGATGGSVPELTYREGSIFFDNALAPVQADLRWLLFPNRALASCCLPVSAACSSRVVASSSKVRPNVMIRNRPRRNPTR